MNTDPWLGGTAEPIGADALESPCFPDRSRQNTCHNGDNVLSNQSTGEMEESSPPRPSIDHRGKESHDLSQNNVEQHQAATGCISNVVFKDSPSEVGSQPPATAKTHVMFSHYSFLEMNSLPHMSPEDVNFLELQGCLRLPMRPILDEFTRGYFLHVHPSLLMLEEGYFWEMYSCQDSHRAKKRLLSLFVFQAMLFAACSFVSQSTIAKLGFANTRNARATYYRRAKLLFDFDGQKDSVSTAQGTLLLSYHSPMRNHMRVNSFWLAIAIQCAKDANAHQYHTSRKLADEHRNTLKRLWWCCILRDRILPLGVRRPLQISLEDFDFTAAPLVAEDFKSEIERSEVYDAATKRHLVQILATLCDLAISLTHVIMLVYPLHESRALHIQTEEASQQYIGQIEMCRSRLDRWYERASIYFPFPAGVGDAHDSLVLHTNLMYIYYHSAKMALAHHKVLVAISQSIFAGSHWRQMVQTRIELEEAVGSITDNLKELIRLKLARYMPISVVAYAAFPLVVHILDVKLATTASQRAIKQRRLNIYTEAMKALQSQYDGTDQVSKVIVRMMDHIKLDTPPRPSGLETDDQRISSRHGSSLKLVNDWGDVFLRQPSCYLRLTLTIDLSLSKGQFPDDADFPPALQSASRSGSHFPAYWITMSETNTSNANTFVSENSSHSDAYNTNVLSELEVPEEDFTTFGTPMQEEEGFGLDYSSAWTDGTFLGISLF